MSAPEFGVTAPPVQTVPRQRPQQPAAVRRQDRAPTVPPERARPARRTAVREPETPWVFSAPRILMACIKVALAPLHLVVLLSELVMAALILGVVALAAGWWLGFVTDAQVLDAVRPIGERLLSMVQSLGYL